MTAMKVKLTDDVSVRSASEKLAIFAAIGITVGIIAGLLVSWAIAPLIAWDTVAAGFIAATWLRITQYDAKLVKKHALREDPSRAITDIVLIAAALASLAAVAVLLSWASQSDGAGEVALAGLSVLSIATSWALVHTVYALKYAKEYYTSPEGGVDFGDNAPVYLDFAYLAFTIGMTYQVSDTSLKSKAFRREALKHSLLAYLLGTGIIATSINLVAGLAK